MEIQQRPDCRAPPLPLCNVHSIGFSAAGLYSVIISNPCGVVTGYVRLTVTQPLPWTNAWWNVSSLTSPLGATLGPDLVLAGTNLAANFAVSAGTTEDFGLPNPGGQIVNVMNINPQGWRLHPGASHRRIWQHLRRQLHGHHGSL